ncbi:nitroreductase family protein [Maridesulfovibrio salexigens]|uniref:Nitroreductase n=1 Tax=Maridesulfovibrio salexigens (strain ATCC 14822 / DSM 2638 / NCIMB 8403 / VKM B-1763) TaxID=526222 RepID=C6BUL4_MARSD|nr:nitroreductase family protein [Maridesulfovibrio salexigens]ACS81808.1 nitroreductase [Maridesulfovibrio salexigens DSM 2638]
MDVFEAIHSRRSIRKFEDKAVSEEDIKDILGAAMMAPSAGNAQPWQFVVVDDREKLNAVPDINEYAAMAKNAPLGILVCGDLSLEKYAGYWVQDCSAAIQNLLLATHAKGLGAVWTGIHPIEERVEGFKKLFNLPEQVIPLGFMVIGHPKQEPKRKDRYKEERVHRNSW